MEVEAAIVAADKFCEHSPSVIVGLEFQLCSMITALETPPPLQLRLIPLLRHNYGSTAALERTQSFCEKLLAQYPTSEVYLAVIRTLSLLHRAVPVHAAAHAISLCTWATQDPRWAVKDCALRHLARLCPSLEQLPAAALAMIWMITQDAPQPSLRGLALTVLAAVAKHQDVLSQQPLSDLLVFMTHMSAEVAAAAASVCAALARKNVITEEM